MLGSPAGPGGPSQRGLWPLAPAPAPSNTFSTDGLNKTPYLYSLFPGGPTFGSALYSHASTIGRFASGHLQQSSGNAFHTAHKVSDSLFSTTGYTFGAPTPPPGSPYSPIPVAQLELLTKGYSNNIIIQQSQDFPSSPKKLQITEKRCDEKCCSIQKAHCPTSPSKKIHEISTNGCSRTNPIEWTGVNVKKEPGTPCQVAEITTSMSPVVKLEVTSPTQKSCIDTMSVGGSMMGNSGAQIPVGIAVARQRVQHEVVASPSLPPAGLLATVNTGGGAQIKEIDNAGTVTSMAAGTSGAAPGGGTLLQCADDRNGGLATWSTGGNHSQTLATPTLWQYPAPVPVEPMVPLPVPTMPPVGGFQLVRDPTTGGLLLLPTTTGIEPIQQTVVWPSYPQPSSVLLPSISSMQPPPLQLLSSASSDYLSSSTTLHQHTQTHSTRLVAVTTDAKRKIPLPLPATTLIKIESDGGLDQSKALQAVNTIANSNGTVFADQSVQPLVTTHVIYQHPTNLIVSQTPMSDNMCRSQATSPACLTPPPDIAHIQEEEHNTSSVQDANIQTDTPICSEDDNTIHTICDVIGEEKIKELPEEVVEDQPTVEEAEEAQAPEAVVEDTSAEEEPTEAISSTENTECKEQPDLSGLELLSNSIVEFENCRAEETPEDSAVPVTVEDNNLGGLDLLCALAEQRIMEESIDKQDLKEKRRKDKERRREKRKSKKHSDEPKRKKMKSHRSSEDRHRDKERRRKEKRRELEREQSEECSCKFKHYKTPESEQEVKKFLESKAPQICCQGEWPCMNAMELDMRIKLAELQKEYREKQQELSQLKPKKHHHTDCPKKKSRKKSTCSDKSSTPPVEDVPVRSSEVLRPSKLSVVPKLVEVYKRRHSEECDKEPKKRKVGRPKRVSSDDVTETLVAKKTNFVGCLLAAKEKLKQKNKECPDTTPPRYVEETYTHKLKRIKNNNNTIVMDDMKSSKIRPKLKAEATVKVEDDEDNLSWSDEVIDHIEEDIDEEEEAHLSKDTFSDSGVQDKEESFNDDFVDKSNLPNPCALTEPHLEMDKLRVLTAMGGLFYAGQLNAVEPPDVYSITLDGERGNRPHIMSREEILRDAIVEVSPKSTEELPVGTRLCAYWSQQYRCLYPGSAAEPGTPDPHLDGKFVSVEFDDGDSGRIALQDIRLLPPNYPIMEYDPNPLLSLSKRKRRASTSISTEEKHPPETLRSECESKLEASEEIDYHKEKKRLKKKKRDRILEGDDKRKKKRHKCVDEFCKHKKHHKKHKKHRKHKDKLRQELVCEIITEEPKVDTYQEYPNCEPPVNPDDEVTMDDLIESSEFKKSKKLRDRQESCESRSKMSAFLPARQLWHWSGKGFKRARAKGKKKCFYYKSIQREKESITVGDAAVFLSTGRPDRPFIGRIEAMWEACGKMVVKVKWFYHPEETVGCPNLQYPGALFESPHVDLNDVQTISHKCEVIPLKDYIQRLGDDPAKYATIYDNNDIYYLAGYYHHISLMLKMEPGIPSEKT